MLEISGSYTVIYDVGPCSRIAYQHFRGAWCLHHSLDDTTAQKSVILYEETSLSCFDI